MHNLQSFLVLYLEAPHGVLGAAECVEERPFFPAEMSAGADGQLGGTNVARKPEPAREHEMKALVCASDSRGAGMRRMIEVSQSLDKFERRKAGWHIGKPRGAKPP